MPIKYKYSNLKEIPAEDVRLYVERGGEWILDADVEVGKAKFEEFRANNIALAQQLKRFEGIDPDAVRQLEVDKQRLEDEQRIKDGKFQEVLDTRLKTARADWEKQHGVVVAERDALHGRLTAIQIDQAVVNEATKRGLRPTAIQDITSRARMTFKLVDGVPQAFDGEKVRTGKDGVSPMTLAEWVDGLVGDAPHLFEANAGSGAAGSGGGAASASARAPRNPFRKETWNLTEQMKIQKTDPALAARLKAAA
jgi:hypothetical protein